MTVGAWYRNSQDENRPFERFVFDADLASVHDVVAADIEGDGDGRQEIVTMSDRNTLRWYRIPDDPTGPWVRGEIGPPVHSGAAVGDVTGNGRTDVIAKPWRAHEGNALGGPMFARFLKERVHADRRPWRAAPPPRRLALLGPRGPYR